MGKMVLWDAGSPSPWFVSFPSKVAISYLNLACLYLLAHWVASSMSLDLETISVLLLSLLLSSYAEQNIQKSLFSG